MIPDLEKVASGYLRAHADVVALGTRIVGKTPPDTEQPWVRLTQLNAVDSRLSRAEHLIEYLLQLDVYAGAAGGQPQANLHARTIRDVLHQMPGAHGDTVVTSVRFTGHLRLSDGEFEPDRDRLILSAVVHAHPA